MSAPPVARPLTIFCGKGGVGKTTLSLAFALRHAEQGRAVVVVTSHPLRELAVSVSLAGLKEAHPQAAANLFVLHVDPREVLNQKVQQQIPSGLLAQAVLSSRIYQALIEVAPGLKELAFLARLQELAQERTHQGAPGTFDVLVWDAPASGHFLQTLKVCRNFDLYLSGPFALIGKQLDQFFSDPSHFTLIPVTTLEEMAVEETMELSQKLTDELKMRPQGLICNLTSPLLSQPESELEALYRQCAGQAAGSEELQFILDRHKIERALFQKLRASMECALYPVPRRAHWKSDLELLLDLSGEFEKIPNA